MPTLSTRSRITVEALVAALLALLLALLVIGPILGSLDRPWGRGDMFATYVNVDTWGWFGFAHTTHYGFPDGMNLDQSPGLDIIANTFGRLCDAVFGNPFIGLNLIIIVSFPLTAGLAYLALRMVSRGGPLAIVLAAAVTVIPFHFGRALGHTYLATMVGAAAGIVLALAIGQGRVNARTSTAAKVAIALLVIVTAWSGLYYAVFGVLLALTALIWRITRRDSIRHLISSALPPLGIIVLIVIGFIPGLLARITDPLIGALAERSPRESVDLAGSLALALTPAPIAMGPKSGWVNQRIVEMFPDLGATENLLLPNYGTWITTLAALVLVIGWVVRARRGTTPRDIPLIAMLLATTVLFFVPWGLNYLFATMVTPQIRAWNRLLPTLLMLLVIGSVAIIADTRWVRDRRWSVVSGAVVLGVVIVTQVLPFRPAFASGADDGRKAVAEAVSYATALNQAIPERCGVLQLPYVGYPEQGTTVKLTDYEHFIHPLVNEGKDFSYGAVRNTAAGTLTEQIGNVPSRRSIDTLRELGFCAIHLDARGFEPDQWVRVNKTLTRELGEPVASGRRGTWMAYRIG